MVDGITNEDFQDSKLYTILEYLCTNAHDMDQNNMRAMGVKLSEITSDSRVHAKVSKKVKI